MMLFCFLFLRDHCHTNLKDAPVVQASDGDVQIFIGEAVALHRQTPKLIQHPSADGGGVDVHSPGGEAVKKIVEIGGAGNQITAPFFYYGCSEQK